QEIYKDRQKFSDQVFRVASSDLVNMGISVVSYTLKDVHDEQVTHLGMAGDSWGHTWGQPGYILDTPGSSWGELGQTWGAAGDTWAHLGHTWDTTETLRTHLGHIWRCPGTRWGHLGHTWAQLGHLGGTKTHLGYVWGGWGDTGVTQRVQLQEQEVGRRRQELEATVRKPAEAERYRLERLAEAQR
ncbi:FLOT1 protein, partial [Rhodinocichla rosea]|nr:FLOT1 protein [Rhodinocichla rosea]